MKKQNNQRRPMQNGTNADSQRTMQVDLKDDAMKGRRQNRRLKIFNKLKKCI